MVVSIRAERSEIAIGDELAVSRGEMEKTRAKISCSGSLNRVPFLNDTSALIRDYHLRFALAAYQLLSRRGPGEALKSVPGFPRVASGEKRMEQHHR